LTRNLSEPARRLIAIFAGNVQRLRSLSGLTQATLASRLPGKNDEAVVSRVENATDHDFKLSTVARFAVALECEPAELFVSPVADEFPKN
jgi:transcriptional regulator with XRE-family HTH domain